MDHAHVQLDSDSVCLWDRQDSEQVEDTVSEQEEGAGEGNEEVCFVVKLMYASVRMKNK